MKTLLLALLALTEAACAFASERVTVYNYDGNPNYIRNRKTYPIDLDMTLRDGDLLRVDADGFLDLSMSGIAGGRIADEGECLVVATSASGMRFNLLSGSFLANVRKLPTGRFEVETPIAAANTEYGLFAVRILPDAVKGPTSRFTVKKGILSVYVKESSVTVTVLDGQTLDVPTGSFIPSPRTAEDDEKKFSDKAMGVYIDDSEQNPPPPSE